jgi:hypothetical protein
LTIAQQLQRVCEYGVLLGSAKSFVLTKNSNRKPVATILLFTLLSLYRRYASSASCWYVPSFPHSVIVTFNQVLAGVGVGVYFILKGNGK